MQIKCIHVEKLISVFHSFLACDDDIIALGDRCSLRFRVICICLGFFHR